MKKKHIRRDLKLATSAVVGARVAIEDANQEIESLQIQVEQQEEALSAKDAEIAGLKIAEEKLLFLFDRNSTALKEAIYTMANNQPSLKEMYALNDARKIAEARAATMEQQLTEMHERIALSHITPGPLTEVPHELGATAKGIIHFALCDLAQCVDRHNLQPHKWTGRQIREIALDLATKADFAVKAVFKELGLHRFDEPLEGMLEQPATWSPDSAPDYADAVSPVDDLAVVE